MRKLILTILSCLPVLLHAQQVESEAERKLQIARYRQLVDSTKAAIDKEPTAVGKEKIIGNFPDGTDDKASLYRMQKEFWLNELAVAFAAENNEDKYKAYLSKIKSPYTRADVSRRAAIAYSKAGNQSLAVEMLKPILDSLLSDNGTIPQKGLSTYTYTVQAYMEILKPGSEQEVLYYLKPLLKASGDFFPSDLSSKPSTDVRSKLFYVYAKALPPVSSAKEIAKVISTAFQNGAVPAELQASVLKDFSNVPDLQQNLAENNKSGKQHFNDALQKLLAKTDINEKVWGAEAFKGKYVLVDFWGSWCIPCRASHPHLKEVYNKYKNKGFEIVGVARESSDDLEKAKLSWKQAVKQDGIDWIHVLANENLAAFDPVKAFGIGVFPTKILLDKDGTEIARYTGTSSEAFDKKMKVLFGF